MHEVNYYHYKRLKTNIGSKETGQAEYTKASE